jgi:2-polyprenyl-3-methyl-5-hydroxy-6-metoxy-1,4-benzoquinol methylase
MDNKAEYDTQAADYDKSRFMDSLGCHLDYMHKKILAQFVDPSTKLLLEAGVGTGRFAMWLAKKGFEVIGIDLSKEMLKKAKEKKAFLKVDVALVLAEVHHLPFKQGLFDACICVNAIDHFPDVAGFLRQVKYVIKHEGYLVFNFSNLQSLYLPIALAINSNKQAMFRGGKIQSNWFTFKKIDDMLTQSGFVVTKVKGCFIASPVPWGNTLVKIIQAMNFSAEDSRLKLFAGSPFIKAKTHAFLKYSH